MICRESTISAALNRCGESHPAAKAKPAVKTTLNQVGFEVLGTSPEELGTLVRSEIDAWGRYVKEFDLKIE